MSQKNILIIKACGVTGEEHECANIKLQADLYGIAPQIIEPKDVVEMYTALNDGTTYDYIYLSSHGSAEGLCNHDESIKMSWEDFGFMLCDTGCMKENCILMLSCCRGGLNQVAYQMLYSCEKISYIVGPRQALPPADMLMSFSLLLYNLTFRGLDPIVACEKIKDGTDIRFVCFDRLEVETDPAYMMWITGFQPQFSKPVPHSQRIVVELPPKEPDITLQ